MTSTEIAVPTELLDVRTGEVLEPTAVNAVQVLFAAREMRARMSGLIKDAEAILLEESRRQGTKTLRFEDATATVSGGSDLEWDLDVLLELRDLGLPEERYAELVVATVSYKVNAAVAKQLEGSNPAYAEIIDQARSRVEKPFRVSVK